MMVGKKTKKTRFEFDWRFSAEDVIWNAERVVGKLPIKYIEDRQVYGEWVEVVLVGGKEICFNLESKERAFEIIDLINEHLPDKSKEFKYYDTGGDSYGFELVKRK